MCRDSSPCVGQPHLPAAPAPLCDGLPPRCVPGQRLWSQGHRATRHKNQRPARHRAGVGSEAGAKGAPLWALSRARPSTPGHGEELGQGCRALLGGAGAAPTSQRCGERSGSARQGWGGAATRPIAACGGGRWTEAGPDQTRPILTRLEQGSGPPGASAPWAWLWRRGKMCSNVQGRGQSPDSCPPLPQSRGPGPFLPSLICPLALQRLMRAEMHAACRGSPRLCCDLDQAINKPQLSSAEPQPRPPPPAGTGHWCRRPPSTRPAGPAACQPHPRGKVRPISGAPGESTAELHSKGGQQISADPEIAAASSASACCGGWSPPGTLASTAVQRAGS